MPLSLLIKPASGLCNLRCRYCFYADEMNNREIPSFGIMSQETLDCVLQRAFEYETESVSIAFQGGEPTLAGLEFFQRAVADIRRFNTRKIPVSLAIQTNGIVLDEQWAKFLGKHHFLVGLSLDGTREIHDRNRVDPAGQGTFDTVLDRARLLDKYGVEFNILTVVTGTTAGNIGKIYRFFEREGLCYQQYIPCLDPLLQQRGTMDYSLTPKKYEHFLKTLFDNWYRDIKAGKHCYNRYFENLVGMLLGHPPESCGMIGHCSQQNVIEADGSVYPCDFYVLDQYKLGNLREESFEDIQRRRQEIGFIETSCQVASECRGCKWYPICRGGCRRDREQPDGTLGRNYYCSAYQGFFDYSITRLEELAAAVRRGALRR